MVLSKGIELNRSSRVIGQLASPDSISAPMSERMPRVFVIAISVSTPGKSRMASAAKLPSMESPPVEP